MNKENAYDKLQTLILVCKRTKNFKKLADTGYYLVSNQANEIGIRLGFRARKSISQSKSLKFFTNKVDYRKEMIYEYLDHINSNFSEKLDVKIFGPKIIKNLKKVELLYIKSNGNLELNHTSTLFDLYFELKKLEIPNLHKKVSKSKIYKVAPFSIYSSFLNSFNSNKNKEKEEREKLGIKNLIFFQLQKKERALKTELQRDYDPKLLETILMLNQIK
jgi:hypothetical protein